MTKEIKIALVVGFALILIVGILISDHLSTARSQEPADLLTARDRDPLIIESGRETPSYLLFPPGGSPSDARATETAAVPRENAGLSAALGNAVAPGPVIPTATPAAPAVQPTRAADGASAASDPSVAFHTIRAGESLTTICRHHYGDGAMVADLARFNGLTDPDRIHVGVRLRIPSAETLRPGTAQRRPSASPPAARGAKPPKTEPARSYTVKPGDTLSILAQRLLGSARRQDELYQINRDTVDDPDHLLAGTTLRLPPHLIFFFSSLLPFVPPYLRAFVSSASMFPKLVAILLTLVFTAASLLVERQRRLELSHRASAIHRRLNEQEARCWAVQAQIAERSGLEQVRKAMHIVCDTWMPIGAQAQTPVELACASAQDPASHQATAR